MIVHVIKKTQGEGSWSILILNMNTECKGYIVTSGMNVYIKSGNLKKILAWIFPYAQGSFFVFHSPANRFR
jgi:hypothetical protein